MNKKVYQIDILKLANDQPGQIGAVLLSRRLAMAIKAETDHIIQEKHDKEGYRIFNFDFTGVQYTDHSFFEVLIVETQIDFMRKDDLLLYCSNMQRDVSEMLEVALIVYNHMLQKRAKFHKKLSNDLSSYPAWLPRPVDGEPAKVLVLIHFGGRLVVSGDLELALVSVVHYLIRCGHITARELAEHRKVTINNASIWLKRLYNLRLVLRDEDTDYTYGRQHIYWLPDELLERNTL